MVSRPVRGNTMEEFDEEQTAEILAIATERGVINVV